MLQYLFRSVKGSSLKTRLSACYFGIIVIGLSGCTVTHQPSALTPQPADGNAPVHTNMPNPTPTPVVINVDEKIRIRNKIEASPSPTPTLTPVVIRIEERIDVSSK